YNSNVFADGAEEKPFSGATLRFFGILGKRFFSDPSMTWDLNYSLSWEEILDLEDGRLVQHSITGPLSFFPGKGVFRITPSVSYQQIFTKNFRVVPGVQLSYESDRKPKGPGLSYFFGRNIPIDSEFSYLKGNIHQAQAFWKWPWGVRGNHRLFYTVVRFESNPLPISGGTLPLQYNAHGPGYRFLSFAQSDWRHEGAISYLFKDYEGVTTPLGNKRNDQQLAAFLRSSTPINRELDFFVNSSLIWNRSTIDVGEVDNRDFTQFVIYAGIAWKF
nr:hypothetical protein [Calditrichia bacterium]NIV71212.1 hypothetical protein [Calditrichia bacterium]NIW77964.1 hypothetical protein [Calditrichia bacterium]